MTQEALKLALYYLEQSDNYLGSLDHSKPIAAIKEALAQPQEEKLHPVHIGVDVAKEGTTVTAFYRKPDAVMEMFYSQFHPMAQPEQEPVAWEQFYPDIGKPQIEQPKVRTGDCLLVGVCASEGHKIQKAQPEQEPVKMVAYNCTCGRTMNFESDHGVVAPQRTWVALTAEDRLCAKYMQDAPDGIEAVIDYIENKLKEKNGFAEEKIT